MRKTLRSKIDSQTLAVFISALALAVSIRGCSQSDRALHLTERESERAILAVWTGKFSPDNLTLRLTSMDDKMSMQRAVVWLPPGFHWEAPRPDFVLTPPDYAIPLQPVTRQIKSFLQERGFAQKTGKDSYRTTSGGDQALPIVIESTYVAKGEVHSDRALYFLCFNWKPPKFKSPPPPFVFVGEPAVSFTGVQLEQRIDRKTQLDQTLTAALNRSLRTTEILDPYVDPYRRPWFK